MHLNTERAEAFNKVAEEYERFRPGYPDALRDSIEQLALLRPGADLLEIGVGPGQATRLFLNRGFRIVGNEPGDQLRSVAWKSLKQPADLSLEGGNFEDWDAADRKFDLIYSGSAFHWVNPEVGFPKVARLLRPNGCMALFWNMFPGNDDPIWTDIEKAYLCCAPSIAEKRFNCEFDETIEKRRQQINQTGLFGELTIHHFPWSKTFTAQEFIELHMTYSDHILLPADQREKLFAELSAVIARYGNKLIRPWDAVLFFARLKSA
ncbi:MAG: class I SAM-dependent methyltransferase [Candidatus Riflebacteria bacterium]|nr:class I SAM-dependent methyltransferase [Candidatus Riflebacteria bacterium]